MAMTIHPAVSGTRKRWGLESALFAAGAFLGPVTSLVAVSLVLTALDALMPLALLAGLGAALIAWAALRDLGIPVPLPYRQRQVPERFREWMPRESTAVIFGFMLGVGFLTLFTYSVQLAFLVAIPFTHSTGALIGAAVAFALGKSVVLVQALQTDAVSEVVARLAPAKKNLALLRAATAAISATTAALLIVAT
jgi:hypothetical protein